MCLLPADALASDFIQYAVYYRSEEGFQNFTAENRYSLSVPQCRNLSALQEEFTMKKALAAILVITVISASFCMALPAYASNGGEPDYAQSMKRLMDLGIFSPTRPDKMDLDKPVTREQLATVIIKLTGHEDKASLYKNSGLFQMCLHQDGLRDMLQPL